MNRIGRDFRPHVEIELFKAFLLGFLFMEAALRNRKDHEKDCSEGHARNGRDSL